MQCTRCGFVNPPGQANVCAQCGAPFAMGADPALRAILPVGRTALSIVAGYLAFTTMFCFPSPFVLGIGIWAAIDVKKRPGMHGMGRAIFAIVMGGIGTVAMLVWIVAALVAR
jgi:hypothetical protein